MYISINTEEPLSELDILILNTISKRGATPASESDGEATTEAAEKPAAKPAAKPWITLIAC